MENRMRLEFDAVSVNESFARVAVSAFFAQLNPTVDEIEDVKTAVSEAVTNSIIHGYGEKEGTVVVTCTYHDKDSEVVVIDEGVGIADIEKSMEPFLPRSRNWSAPVWGLHLWRHLWTKCQWNRSL